MYQTMDDCKFLSAIDMGWGISLGSANTLSVCAWRCPLSNSFLQSRSKYSSKRARDGRKYPRSKCAHRAAILESRQRPISLAVLSVCHPIFFVCHPIFLDRLDSHDDHF